MVKVVGSIDRRHESRDYQRGKSIKSVASHTHTHTDNTAHQTHTGWLIRNTMREITELLKSASIQLTVSCLIA